MANFISYLPVISPFLNNHTFALFDLKWVKLIIYIHRRVVHILIAKGGSSGQYEENSGFNACLCILLKNYALIQIIKKGKDSSLHKDSKN